MTRAAYLIRHLDLQPHPERGYYAETYRAEATVTPADREVTRSASTAIYFLITAEQPTTYLHRLKSDEVFHFYEGGPLDVLRLSPDGTWDVARLGTDLDAGERPQIVMTAGTWFGTELAAGTTHCLIGCTVAPGFDFEDFELSNDMDLAARYPAAADRIARMSRPSDG